MTLEAICLWVAEQLDEEVEQVEQVGRDVITGIGTGFSDPGKTRAESLGLATPFRPSGSRWC